ncbi:MAG: GtrA family protein [Rhodoglobus sp.]|nr:GtrA family protein [Rhodoglobus sp.]
MLRNRLWSLLRDLLRFGMVGGLGLLVDIGLFNLLRLTVLADDHIPGAPLIAKTISVLAAIAANWAGNRWWAFRDRRGGHPGREALAFLLVSLAGSAISLMCLGLTHYAFGLTSPVADNISANIIGLCLGSAFRFVAVRTWVFKQAETVTTAAPEPLAVT